MCGVNMVHVCGVNMVHVCGVNMVHVCGVNMVHVCGVIMVFDFILHKCNMIINVYFYSDAYIQHTICNCADTSTCSNIKSSQLCGIFQSMEICIMALYMSCICN